jgi:hypothetical protein
MDTCEDRTIQIGKPYVTKDGDGIELFGDILEFWKDKGLPIPKRAYTYAERFLDSMDGLKETMI